eukprot:7377514-Prymnesium_polylepis.1
MCQGARPARMRRALATDHQFLNGLRQHTSTNMYPILYVYRPCNDYEEKLSDETNEGGRRGGFVWVGLKTMTNRRSAPPVHSPQRVEMTTPIRRVSLSDLVPVLRV